VVEIVVARCASNSDTCPVHARMHVPNYELVYEEKCGLSLSRGAVWGICNAENYSAVILAYHASMSSMWNSSMMKSVDFSLKEHCSQAGLCNAKSELDLWRDSSFRWRGPLCCCSHSAAVTRRGRCKLLALQYCPESGTLVLLERLTCKPVQDCMFW
jgi:hypothetical protein